MFAVAGCKIPTIKSKSRSAPPPPNQPRIDGLTRRMRAVCPKCGVSSVRLWKCANSNTNTDVGLFYVSTWSICASWAYANFKSIDYFKRPAWVRVYVCVFKCQANQFPNCWPKNRYNYRRRCIIHHNTHGHEYALY